MKYTKKVFFYVKAESSKPDFLLVIGKKYFFDSRIISGFNSMASAYPFLKNFKRFW